MICQTQQLAVYAIITSDLTTVLSQTSESDGIFQNYLY